MTKKIRPLEDRVLMKAQKPEEKTPGGIIIPETAQDKQVQFFEVIAVGPGLQNDNLEFVPVGVKPGEVVIAQKFAGSSVEIDGEKFTIMREGDIHAVIE